MAESPLKIAYILWGSAALMLVLGAAFYLDLFGLDIDGGTLALLCVVSAVLDIGISAVFLSRSRR